MTKPNYWMVRAGRDSVLFDKFETDNIVAINFPQVGEVVGKSEEEIRATVDNNYHGYANQKKGGIVGMHVAFCTTMQIGEGVATYNRDTREYLLGEIIGECKYQETEDGYRHFRAVRWGKKILRDSLPDEVKNSLGALSTIFSVKPDHWNKMMEEEPAATVATSADDEDDTVTETPPPERKWENEIRDAIEGEIKRLSPREMERLVAALLKAMGYNSTVTAQSGDGGYDIYASPDGLLFEEPRIRAEVKHRQGKMDVGDIRQFASAKGTARGVYVSIGGYTKEAITEARGKDITVLNLPQLAELVVQYYDNFDMDGRMLLPMKKIYLPVKPSRSV